MCLFVRLYLLLFLSYLSSLQILPVTLKFMDSFFINCFCMHVYYFLNITCWICITFYFVQKFSDLSIWHWITYWYAAPWGRPPLPFPDLISCPYCSKWTCSSWNASKQLQHTYIMYHFLMEWGLVFR